MGTGTGPETGRDRRALVADAGFKAFSLPSAVAGAVAAFGTLAVLVGVAAAVIRATGHDIDVSSSAPWRPIVLGESLIAAGVLAVAFLFGGYIAGRMARRAGIAHGIAVFLLGLAGVAAAAAAADLTADAAADVVVVAVAAAVAAMLAGSLVGGVMGERWHAKLVSRALDPRIGAEADARRDADQRAAEAERLRVASYRRARLATPSRTRRVDREAADGVRATRAGNRVRATKADGGVRATKAGGTSTKAKRSVAKGRRTGRSGARTA